MLLWVHAGPLRGRFLELPLEDALQAIDDDWAEQVEGRINHPNPFRFVSDDPHAAAERYAVGKSGKRSEPPPDESPPVDSEKSDKASSDDRKTPHTYDDRELTSDRERQTRRRRQTEPPSL